VVTNGGKQAVYQAFQAVVNPGDDVLLPRPYWTTYPEAIALADGIPVEVFAGADQEYKVTVEQLEAARTRRHDCPCSSRPRTRPDRCTPRRRPRRSASGRSSTASGSSRTRSIRTSSTKGARAVSIVEAVPDAAAQTILVTGSRRPTR
jgi:aspartate aminotransferase